MSQSNPNKRKVRRIPVNWPDQENAIENAQVGPVVDASTVPIETAVATAEPEPEVAQATQIPARRARGAATAAVLEEPEYDEYDEYGYEDEDEIEEEPLPAKKAGGKGKGKAKGGKQAAAPSNQAASVRAKARQTPVPAPRTGRSMIIPISIGIMSGAVLGLIIIAILLATRNNETAPPQQVGTSQGSVDTIPTSADDTSAPAALPTQPEVIDTPTINTADASATPSGLFETGPANAARGRFNLPRGIALDTQGNYYVADSQNERIEKFDPSGKFLLAFGSKGSAEGQFNPMADDAVGTGPSGLAVDAAGNIYVADTWNHRVQKFDPNGKFITQWGAFATLTDPDSAKDPATDSKFWGPRDVAIAPDGSVYVTDTGNKRILIFDANGKFLRKIDSGLDKTKVDSNYPFNKPGELNEPIGLAIDGTGNVYVADTRNNRVQKFDKAGKPVAQWPMPEGSWAPGPYLEPYLDVDSAGNVYVTAPSSKSVVEFSPDGKVLGQKNKQGNVTLQTPTGIAVAKDGTIYVVDTNSNAVINFGKMP